VEVMMDGDKVRAIREARKLTQDEFAVFVNGLCGRKYDKAKISRWETGAERVPADVAGLLAITQTEVRRRDRAIIVAIALQKGGVAKTSTAINVGYVLAKAGALVLLVDADTQGNASLHVGVEHNTMVGLARQGKTLYEVLTGKAQIDDVILPTSIKGLDVLPATVTLAQAERELPIEPPTNMRKVLATVRTRYDVILIDCPPSLGTVTLHALTAADRVLIPCQTEPLAITGLSQLHVTVTNLQRRHNPRLGILGIVPTLFSSRLTQDKASLEDLKASWSQIAPILEPVPKSTVYPQSAGGHVITLAADPSAPGLATYLQIIDLLNATEIAHGT
jgi:cellulose biosynthesis protein BcsQ